MVDRSVHLSVRGLVEGVAPPAGVVAAPQQKAALGGFDVALEAARDRILPGEENELVVVWKAREAAARAKVKLFIEVPAELAGIGAGEAKVEEWGASGQEGEARFRVAGQEPGGVWVDCLLTFEDEMGAVLARLKAGFSIARHRVVISGVEVEPPVVAAGGACVVKARFAWTGQARLRGTLGGALRRREDGAELELFREKVSALGEREQEWRVRAPVDLAVADYDVELSFEGKETGSRAQFGKTGVLAVRRPRDAEVSEVVPAKMKWGAEEAEAVKAVVRNTGVEPLEGQAALEVYVRLPGAAEAVIVARAAEPEHVPIKVAPAASAEARFRVRLPRGVEGRRIEGRVVATFGALTAERREVIGHLAADHLLEFDGFAADKYAYGAGEEAVVECRVRDDGARPGGSFDVALRVLAGSKEVAAASARVEMTGGSAPLRGVLRLPHELPSGGAFDLEVAVKEAGALRRVEGFLRVRQKVAARVAVVKPAEAAGRASFLFDGEAVSESVPLGAVAGEGEATLVVTDEPGYFVEIAGAPAGEGGGPLAERAASKAVAAQAGAPPPIAHAPEWARLIERFTGDSKRAKHPATGSPSDLEERMSAGTAMASAGAAGGALRQAIRLTGEALSGAKVPASEVAAAWMKAAEGGAAAAKDREAALARAARALDAARQRESDALKKLRDGGLDVAEAESLAEAAIWRRALEAEFMALALDEDGHDRVVQLSASLKEAEVRIRDAVRYYARFATLASQVAKQLQQEARERRRLAALRSAQVEVRGASAIVPGTYNALEVEARLPAGALAGGRLEAAVRLPSPLWIVASEGARLEGGHYVLASAEVAPGGKAHWKLDLYVPERVGAEQGAVEVRLGFEEGRP